MSPKEKAENIYKKMLETGDETLDFVYDATAKASALICVDEIDLLIQKSTPKDDPYCNLMSLEYWQEVIEEIKKL